MSKSINQFIPKSIDRNEDDKKMMLNAFGEKGKISNYRIHDFELKNKQKKKDAFEIIKNLGDLNVFKVKEILMERFNINFEINELLYKKENKKIINLRNNDTHLKVKDLVYSIEEKKENLINKLLKLKEKSKQKLNNL